VARARGIWLVGDTKSCVNSEHGLAEARHTVLRTTKPPRASLHILIVSMPELALLMLAKQQPATLGTTTNVLQ
jgi:hypothetical protein